MCGRGCQFPRCWVSVSDGLPVGLVAVVSTLDTLPAVSLWPWCRSVGWSATVPAVRVWDGKPVGLVAVVSFLDTLPACELVPWWCRMVAARCAACGGQFPRCWVSVGCAACVLLIGCRGQYPSTLFQPVSLCRGLCVDGLPVAAGMCCLWSVPSIPCQR